MGKNWRRFWVQHIPWSSKVLFCFWFEAYFFFQMVIFATLFRRCPTLWMTTLKMTTLFWRFLTLFNSKLLNVVNFNFDINWLVSIWGGTLVANGLRFMKGIILAKAFSFLLAFLHIFSTWVSSFNLLSKCTTNRFLHLIRIRPLQYCRQQHKQARN